MPLDLVCKNKKITDFTIKLIFPNPISSQRTSQNIPISPSDTQIRKNTKNPKMDTSLDTMNAELSTKNTNNDITKDKPNPPEENAALQNALGLLITEFKLLRELVDTVHADYVDLKQTISKQKDDLQQELVSKIDNNSKQLAAVAQENQNLWKENSELKSRLEKLEQDHLINNVMITGIQEGPYEQYSTTKL